MRADRLKLSILALSKLVTESKSFRNPVLRLYFTVRGNATKRNEWTK